MIQNWMKMVSVKYLWMKMLWQLFLALVHPYEHLNRVAVKAVIKALDLFLKVDDLSQAL